LRRWHEHRHIRGFNYVPTPKHAALASTSLSTLVLSRSTPAFVRAHWRRHTARHKPIPHMSTPIPRPAIRPRYNAGGEKIGLGLGGLALVARDRCVRVPGRNWLRMHNHQSTHHSLALRPSPLRGGSLSAVNKARADRVYDVSHRPSTWWTPVFGWRIEEAGVNRLTPDLTSPYRCSCAPTCRPPSPPPAAPRPCAPPA
jgi:hypothetical protein